MACIASVSMQIGSKEAKTAQKMGRVKEQRGGGEVRKEKLADNSKAGYRTSTYSHGPDSPKFLVSRAQHSCIYGKNGVPCENVQARVPNFRVAV